ncbi:MAG: tRNA lysidine(34) synthetase TilS [Alphaproteobacteria bacterium]
MIEFTDFQQSMNALGLGWSGVSKIAVAVSGGPDSMALCRLLGGWAVERGIEVHALTVDHSLRAESGDEALRVGGWLGGWRQVRHAVLRWDAPVQSAVQEEARRARYGLMAEYCRAHGIGHLFLAHHADDQAETVLFRLAKGSGLDGLAGMQALQVYDEGLVLVRPLLGFAKDDLTGFCEAEGISYIEDPSNENESFARVRLRKSRDILEEEGLSSKRLNVTAKRLSRARKALDAMAEAAYKEAVLKKDADCIVFNLEVLLEHPEEIVLRCVLKAVGVFRPEADYAPRMEKVEALVEDFICGGTFRKRTLGGVVFERDDKGGVFRLSLEK